MRRPFVLPMLLTLPAMMLAPIACAQDLTATIADALAQAPAMAEARADEDSAAARLDGALAESHPSATLLGQVGVGRIDNGGFFGFSAKGVTPLTVQAGAEMPLYTGGRLAAARDQASSSVDVAHLGIAEARTRVTVSAVMAYVEVLTARKIEVRFRQLHSELVEVERQAGLRFKAGDIPNSDLAAATARRAEGDAGLAGAEGRRISAEAQYRRITGHDAGELEALPPLPQVPASLDEAVDMAIHDNPALAQVEKGIAVAQAAVRAAEAERRPTVGAFAEATRTRDQFFPDYRADAVAVGLRGRWTLWSGGRVSAKVREADARLNGTEARAREAHDQIKTAIIALWTNLSTAQRLVVASYARSAATTEALRSTRLEAQVGAKPTLAVLDAEREAMAADAAVIEAQGQRLVAAWQLNALTGAVAQ